MAKQNNSGNKNSSTTRDSKGSSINLSNTPEGKFSGTTTKGTARPPKADKK